MMLRNLMLILSLITLMSATCTKTEDTKTYNYIQPEPTTTLFTNQTVMAFHPTHCGDKVAILVDMDNDKLVNGAADKVFFVKNPNKKWNFDDLMIISFEVTDQFDSCPSLKEDGTPVRFPIVLIKE